MRDDSGEKIKENLRSPFINGIDIINMKCYYNNIKGATDKRLA